MGTFAFPRIPGTEPQRVIFIVMVLAVGLRWTLFGHESEDYRDFFAWYEVLRKNGLSAFQAPFSSYTPFYLYLLYLSSLLFGWLPPVYAVKIIGVGFDAACAFIGYRLVRLQYPDGWMPIAAMFTILFAPTVLINSSFLGQVDMIYTTFLLGAFYFLVQGKENRALVMMGLAFSMKMQALFLAPFLFFLFLRGKVRFRSFLWIPAIFCLSILPVTLVGGNFKSYLFTYFDQTHIYRALAMNVANLYQWVPNEFYDLFYPAGVILTASVMLFFGFLIWKSPNHFMEPRVWITWALISVLFSPYLLPKMHDRYYFAADVFSIVFAFYHPRAYWIPCVVIMVSFFSYFPFFFHKEVIPLQWLAIILLVPMVGLLKIGLEQLYPDGVQAANE